MPGELLVFDAAGSNLDGTDPGTVLNMGPGTLYGIRAFDAPAPPQTVQYAGSVDTEGSLPASRKHENRVLSATILCQTAASLRTLQDKISKVAREGGTLKWVMPNAEFVYFDLHTADTFQPRIDHVLYARAGAYCEAQMTFLARPYGRGAPVALSLHTATAKAPLVFTETGIKGDVPALGSLAITNVTNTKTALYWGIQSRYYSSSAGSALLYEAENGVASAATLNAGPAGASGGGGNKVMKHATVGTSGTAAYLVNPSGTDLNHIGSYRVLVRLQADSANTGIVSSRLQWTPAFGGSTISNDWVAITDSTVAVKGSWVIADLGLITLPKALLGNNYWSAIVDSKSTVAADIVYYDWVALVPVDEGNGRGAAATVLSAGSWSATNNFVVGATAVLVDDVGSATRWARVLIYEGDYLVIPPAGAEGRTVRMICMLAGGNGLPITDTVVDATNLDAITATLTYTPRYLVVPQL